MQHFTPIGVTVAEISVSGHEDTKIERYTELEGHSVECMYLQQSPKSENWASLTPRSSATLRRTAKSTDLGNFLALDYNVE